MIRQIEEGDKVGKEKVNIFKVGSKWRFQGYFFLDDFKDLARRGYYKFDNKLNHHIFEVEEEDEIIEIWKRSGSFVFVEDPINYTIIKEKNKCTGSEHRDAVAVNEKENYKIFIMKDLASVEEQIKKGAKRCVDRTLLPKL